jgi:hypothetical protein
MQTANAATRKEINWQAQLDALVDARRLIAHHTEVCRTLLPAYLTCLPLHYVSIRVR